MLDWRFHMVHTTSGTPYKEIFPSKWNGDLSLNAGMGGSLTLPVSAHPDWSKADWEGISALTNRTLVVSYQDKAVWAGILWRRKYDVARQEFQFTLRDLWSVWEKRYLIRPGDDPAKSVLEFGPSEYPTMAVRVAQHASNDPTWHDNLPIIFPEGYIRGDVVLRYEGHEGTTVADALEQIMSVEGGPDVWFEPHWDDSTIDRPFRWIMHCEVDLNADRQVDVHLSGGAAGTGYTVEHNAENVINNAYVFGIGNGLATASAYDFHEGTEFIQLDGLWSDRRTTQKRHLVRFASERIRIHRNDENVHTMTVHADGTPGLLTSDGSEVQIVPGITINRLSFEDPFLAPLQSFRVAGMRLSVGPNGAAPITLDLRG